MLDGHSATVWKESIVLWGGRFSVQNAERRGMQPPPLYSRDIRMIDCRNLVEEDRNSGGVPRGQRQIRICTFDVVKCNGVAPSGRAFHSATLYRDECLVVVGGLLENPQEQEMCMTVLPTLDLARQRWHVVEAAGDAPSARCHHASALLVDRAVLVVHGGYPLLFNSDLTRHEASRGELLAMKSCLSDVYQLNLEAMAWCRVEAQPGPCLWGHSAIPHRGNIIVFGGVDIDTNAESSSVVVWSDRKRLWRWADCSGPAVASALHSTSVLIRRDTPKMIVFGGLDMSKGCRVSGLREFDLDEGKWAATAEEAGDLPAGRIGHAMVVVGEAHLVLIGGVVEVPGPRDGPPVQVHDESVYTYNSGTGRWTRWALVNGVSDLSNLAAYQAPVGLRSAGVAPGGGTPQQQPTRHAVNSGAIGGARPFSDATLRRETMDQMDRFQQQPQHQQQSYRSVGEGVIGGGRTVPSAPATVNSYPPAQRHRDTCGPGDDLNGAERERHAQEIPAAALPPPPLYHDVREQELARLAQENEALRAQLADEISRKHSQPHIQPRGTSPIKRGRASQARGALTPPGGSDANPVEPLQHSSDWWPASSPHEQTSPRHANGAGSGIPPPLPASPLRTSRPAFNSSPQYAPGVPPNAGASRLDGSRALVEMGPLVNVGRRRYQGASVVGRGGEDSQDGAEGVLSRHVIEKMTGKYTSTQAGSSAGGDGSGLPAHMQQVEPNLDPFSYMRPTAAAARWRGVDRDNWNWTGAPSIIDASAGPEAKNLEPRSAEPAVDEQRSASSFVPMLSFGPTPLSHRPSAAPITRDFSAARNAFNTNPGVHPGLAVSIDRSATFEAPSFIQRPASAEAVNTPLPTYFAGRPLESSKLEGPGHHRSATKGTATSSIAATTARTSQGSVLGGGRRVGGGVDMHSTPRGAGMDTARTVHSMFTQGV